MRLNNKTIRNYLLYSSVIFLLTIPILYFVMRTVLLHSVDHSLKSQLREIRSNLVDVHSREDLMTWSRLDGDISLSPAKELHKDRIYSIDRFNAHHNEKEPWREIAGNIEFDGSSYELIIRVSLVENEDLLGSILMVQAGVLVILIAGMIWLNHKMSKRLWQPFYIALRNMQAFELNKQTDLTFKASTTDEFNELNTSISNLLSRSSELYLQQKEFTENASHEMQTPLAIFQSKLELLMQTSPLAEEQAELINTLDETNRRIIRLNKSLLLLTKIENNQYETTEPIDISGLTERLIDQYQIYAEPNNLRISKDISPDATVNANPTLIETMISNLLSNAIRYNTHNGQIIITADKSALSIQNTGNPTPLNPDKIFERFHKQSRPAGKDDGIGLGLAIVKNICNLYHYTISYSFIDGCHRFEVAF